MQGTVELNGATIEFAELGVSLHQRAPVLLGGGILKASNSKFHDNRRSVSFWDYHNFLPFQPSTTFQNLSYLSDCFFTIDDDFPIENFIVPEFNSHVGLFEVSGIPFSKCIFQDERTNVTKPLQVGSGIYSTNAKFFVNECEFNDLLYGVDANSINATFPFSVRRSTFKGNYSGISARGVNNFTVDDNTFEVGGFTKPVVSANHPTYQTGLFIDQSTGFVVEDNDFKENNVAAASITTNIGICAKNTSLIDDTKNSTDYNEIYGNKFDDLFIGNLANGINRGLLSGLTYLCNENSLDVENVNDFTVHKGVIAKNQIDPNNNSVGNIFTPCTDQDFTHIDNSIDSDFIKYHYSDGSLNDQEEPFCFPDDLVSKLAVSKNECSRGSDHNDFPEDELDEVKSKIEIDKTHFRELLEDYHEAEGEVDSETEIEMTTIKGQLHTNANLVLRHYLSDSTNLQMDSVRYYLDAKTTLDAAYSIVDTYLQQSDTYNALSALEQIENDYELDEDQQAEHQAIVRIKEIEIALIQEGQNWDELDENEILELQTIASEETDGAASLLAQNILNFANGERLYHEPLLPAVESSSKPVDGSLIQNAETQQMFFVDVYPNPASSSVTFVYRLPKNAQGGEIIISNINGQTEKIFILHDETGSFDWSLANMAKGVYFYNLVSNEGSTKTRKLVILE